jgi:hypothetical protein
MKHLRAVPRLLQIAALSAAFVLPAWRAEAADKQGKFHVFGQGNQSCGKWTTDRKEGADAAWAWVLGYASGYNDYGWRGVNVASETDIPGMLAWIDNYCAANSTVPVANAAIELMHFLSLGPHPNDK